MLAHHHGHVVVLKGLSVDFSIHEYLILFKYFPVSTSQRGLLVASVRQLLLSKNTSGPAHRRFLSSATSLSEMLLQPVAHCTGQ